MTVTYGFELIREQEIVEINSLVRLYRHVKTGAQLMSLVNEDTNKCFGITFRTPIGDSTGVAHILEHSVLCGSRKYPVKDPFIELAKGSMNTYLNASTYPDKTCYPVASQNLQDFYNLVDVYLDTVFHPLLTEQTFKEQGWHFEIERPEDEMIYRGVVFNEMKGAFSSPDRTLSKKSQNSLFPDTIYSADSGGDPRHIPDLTYERLKEFHTTYYHPSNSLIWMYGDDDPERRLSLLDGYLREFDPQTVPYEIPLQTRFNQPRSEQYVYAAGEESVGQSNKSMVCVNWLLQETNDTRTILELSLLDQILLGAAASPLRKALIDSGLGEDITGSGASFGLRQMTFSVGLKGIHSDDAEQVEKLILKTLEGLAREGIDPETLEAALNTVEFALRENNTGSFPRGLAFMLSSLTLWPYGGDPIAPLSYEKMLGEIKLKARSGRYFEAMIQNCFLDNSHRTTVLIDPDPKLDGREAAEERERLNRARAEMGEAGVEQAISDTLLLKQRQAIPDPPEAIATIPSLKLEDLEREIKTIPMAVSREGSVPVLYHDLFTNGVVYLDLGMDLHTLPPELLFYVPLFGRALLEMGTEREDYVKLMQRIGQKTGGIRRSVLLSSVQGSATSTAWMFLRGKAVPSRAGELLAIIREMLLTTRLDNRDRFRQMAQEERARQEARIAPGGAGFIGQRMRARLIEADWAAEQMGGISYLFFLRELVAVIETDWPGVLASLERVRTHLVNSRAMLCNLTLDEANRSRFAPELNSFLESLPSRTADRNDWNDRIPLCNEGLTIPGQVNYVGKVANLVELGYRESGATMVILNLLNTSWLWEKVRREGGAYGVSCGVDRMSGVLSFVSYRDPNLLKTLDNFAGSSRFLRELKLSESDLTRSIVGVIGDLDSYQLPDAKGYTSMARFLTGTTDAIRQRLRNEVLACSPADFRAFGELLEQANTQGLVGVLGSQTAIEAANAERPGLFETVKVL